MAEDELPDEANCSEGSGLKPAAALVLIGLGVYLALGLALALVKMPGTYLCPDFHGPSGYASLEEGRCHPIASAGERLRFIGWFIPRWPDVVVREGIGPRPHP